LSMRLATLWHRPMPPKKGRRYRYYVSTVLIAGSRSEHAKSRRIPAEDIEGLVLDRLRTLFAFDAEVSDAIAPLGLDAATQCTELGRSAKLAERWATLATLEFRELMRSLSNRSGLTMPKSWSGSIDPRLRRASCSTHLPILPIACRRSNLWSCQSRPADSPSS
jgi:hypothetical protein